MSENISMRIRSFIFIPFSRLFSVRLLVGCGRAFSIPLASASMILERFQYIIYHPLVATAIHRPGHHRLLHHSIPLPFAICGSHFLITSNKNYHSSEPIRLPSQKHTQTHIRHCRRAENRLRTMRREKSERKMWIKKEYIYKRGERRRHLQLNLYIYSVP